MNLLQTMRHHMKSNDQESEEFLDQVDMLPAKEKETFVRAIEWMTNQNFELMLKDSTTYRQKDWHPGINKDPEVEILEVDLVNKTLGLADFTREKNVQSMQRKRD